MTALSLETQHAIDLQKEYLVPAAEILLDKANIVGMEKKDFGDSQMRNVLAIANETTSPAVVLNFLRYQIGRNTKKNPKDSKGWAWPVGKDTFGHRMIYELDQGIIRSRLIDVEQRIEGLDPDQRQLVNIVLIRHFLGFASRYLKYLDIQRKKPNGEEK